MSVGYLLFCALSQCLTGELFWLLSSHVLWQEALPPASSVGPVVIQGHRYGGFIAAKLEIFVCPQSPMESYSPDARLTPPRLKPGM